MDLDPITITCMIDGNFGNVSAGVLFSKVAYQRIRVSTKTQQTNSQVSASGVPSCRDKKYKGRLIAGYKRVGVEGRSPFPPSRWKTERLNEKTTNPVFIVILGCEKHVQLLICVYLAVLCDIMLRAL